MKESLQNAAAPFYANHIVRTCRLRRSVQGKNTQIMFATEHKPMSLHRTDRAGHWTYRIRPAVGQGACPLSGLAPQKIFDFPGTPGGFNRFWPNELAQNRRPTCRPGALARNGVQRAQPLSTFGYFPSMGKVPAGFGVQNPMYEQMEAQRCLL